MAPSGNSLPDQPHPTRFGPLMTSAEFGSFTLVLLLILATAHLFGYIFQRLRQPRVVGEIVAGILIGPSILGRFAPHFSAAIFTAGAGSKFPVVLFFLY